MVNSDNAALGGVVPIPVTPFTESGALDAASMRRQVDFCVDAGVHGLLYPGVVSEFYTLTEDERRTAVETFVSAVDGRVPVIVGVSAASTAASVEHSRHARSLDVSAVMTMGPFVEHFFPPSAEQTRRHLEGVAEAAAVPVILQNARIGHPVSMAALAQLLQQIPQIEYVKQETNPATQAVSDVIAAVGDRIRGVFGGLGSIYLVNELERGALGTMPSPAFADRIVTAYNTYTESGAEAAQAQLEPLGSLFTRELLYNAVFLKEVLRRRGVLATATVRVASPVLDSVDLDELDRLLRAADLK